MIFNAQGDGYISSKPEVRCWESNVKSWIWYKARKLPKGVPGTPKP